MKHSLSRARALLAKIGVPYMAIASCLAGAHLCAYAESLPFYASADFTPHWLDAGSETLANFHRVSDFQLTNQMGRSVTQADFDQQVYVASFFFSTCPGICPTIRSKLAKVQDAFTSTDPVSIVSYSIRPTTDTPEVLRNYARRNGIENQRWQLLTGDRELIYRLARESYFVNEDLGNIQDLDDFLHTESLLLIDQNRHIRGVYNGLSTSSVEHLIRDIKHLLHQEQDRSADAEAG